mgnify:CR=1 FL=1
MSESRRVPIYLSGVELERVTAFSQSRGLSLYAALKQLVEKGLEAFEADERLLAEIGVVERQGVLLIPNAVVRVSRGKPVSVEALAEEEASKTARRT